MQNHYEILGVDESASIEDIKKSYKKLAMKHHPDRGGDSEKFQSIQEAYSTLSDESSRQEYDYRRKHGDFNHNNFGQTHASAGFDDFLKNFGFSFQQGWGDPSAGFRQYQPPKKNSDMRIVIQVTLKDTMETQKKTISITTGSGKNQIIDIEIPRGIPNTSSIKYPLMGDDRFEDLPRGDLYVNVQVTNTNGYYQVNERDLVTALPIDAIKAITGGTEQINTFDDKVLDVTIPKGIQHGSKLKIGGHGLYRPNSEERGDLFLEIHIRIPTNLSDEQLEAIKTAVQ